MYIVTGGAGFLGSAFVWKLNRMGVRDIVIVDNLGRGHKWRNLVNLDYAEYLHKDAFLAMVRADAFPWNPTAVVHMGACSSTVEADAQYLMDNNFRYSRDLCLWALSKGARYIHASSAATYGDGGLGFSDDHGLMPRLRPLNMYAYSKQLFDLWALRQDMLKDIVCLKFFNVFGPNEYHKAEMRSVACKAFAQIRDTGRLKLFKSYRPDCPDGDQRRDFVYVKDCLEVMAGFLDAPTVNGIFNVGSGLARTWNDLAAAVFSAMGRPVAIDYIEMPESLRRAYQYFTEAPMAKLAAAGIAQPVTSLEDAVKDYMDYLRREDPYLERA